MISVVVVFALMVLIGMLGMLFDKRKHSPSSERTYTPPPVASTPVPTPPSSRDNLSRMVDAFEGNYTRAQIKERLERAMILYNMPINEENYGRAASALIVMRQEHGASEMQILDYMIRSHVPGVRLSFSEAAAISAVFLRTGGG